MRLTPLDLSLLLPLLLAPARPAAAQYGAAAEVDAPTITGNEDDPIASVTTIELGDRARPQERLDEIILEVPSVRALRLGGAGSFSGLSLRGTDIEHTAIWIGSIPLGTAEGGAFDLGTLPPELFSRVEVYRGGAPFLLGEGGIGGVLRLLPREARGRGAEATIGLGSFGEWSARVASEVSAESAHDPSMVAVVGASGSEGAFPYQDDGGTAFDPADDVERRRRNAQNLEGFGLLRADVPLAGGKLEALGLAFARTGGVPGPAVQPTRDAQRSLFRSLIGLAYAKRIDHADETETRYDLLASFAHTRSRFSDLLGEVGLGRRATDDASTRAQLRGAFLHDLSPHLAIGALGTLRYEGYAPEDALARMPNGRSDRATGSIAAEARLRSRISSLRIEARASGRLEASASTLRDTRLDHPSEESDATRLAPTARLGLVLELGRGIGVSTSAYTATRLPSLLELFGDRGYLAGDVHLRPERALGVDLSFEGRGRTRALRVHAEVRGFALRIDDLIRYASSSQYTASPQNVDGATMLGAELALRGALLRSLSLVAAGSVLEARDADDRRLPLRPSLSGYARAELVLRKRPWVRALGLYADIAYLGASFLDAANLVRVDSRVKIGLGVNVSLLGGRLALAFGVRDLFDARGTDVLGFPLPGRSFALALTVKTEASP